MWKASVNTPSKCTVVLWDEAESEWSRSCSSYEEKSVKLIFKKCRQEMSSRKKRTLVRFISTMFVQFKCDVYTELSLNPEHCSHMSSSRERFYGNSAAPHLITVIRAKQQIRTWIMSCEINNQTKSVKMPGYKTGTVSMKLKIKLTLSMIPEFSSAAYSL